MPNYWGPLEIHSLQSAYLTYSLEELSRVSGRSKEGIVKKLEKLKNLQPTQWDSSRIRSFRNEISREYMKGVRENPVRRTHFQELERTLRKKKKLEFDLPVIIKPCLSCDKPFETQCKTNRICPTYTESKKISPVEEFRRYKFEDFLVSTGEPSEPNYPKDASEPEDEYVLI